MLILSIMLGHGNTKRKLGVVGLGYVGLPLALNLAKNNFVVGVDHNARRIQSLSNGIDLNREVANTELTENFLNLRFTSDFIALADCEVIFVCIPTPIDEHNNPDLELLKQACTSIGPNLRAHQIIVFESTVYPGCTEEFCMPILSETSGIPIYSLNIVYSPERINPGDSLDTILKVNKVISGNNEYSIKIVKNLYEQFMIGKVFEAENIKTAEMAKIIENIQRDLNIALMNEISIICNLIDINTRSVLEAAETKWNFIRFNPGLVGGHCIGVDPYYLAAKAKMLNYNTHLILAARKLNNSMSRFIADRIEVLINQKNIAAGNIKALILGFSFKPDVTDTRNTKIYDLVKHLEDIGLEVKIYDPKIDLFTNKSLYPEIEFLESRPEQKFDVIIGAVAHHEFLKYDLNYYRNISNVNSIFFEISNFFPEDLNASQL